MSGRTKRHGAYLHEKIPTPEDAAFDLSRKERTRNDQYRSAVCKVKREEMALLKAKLVLDSATFRSFMQMCISKYLENDPKMVYLVREHGTSSYANLMKNRPAFIDAFDADRILTKLEAMSPFEDDS